MIVKGVRRKEFRKALVEASGGCVIQHDGWPCGSCCYGNGKDWHAILAYRGDYNNSLQDGNYKMCKEIEYNPDGTFKRHVFIDVPVGEIKARIIGLATQLGVYRD